MKQSFKFKPSKSFLRNIGDVYWSYYYSDSTQAFQLNVHGKETNSEYIKRGRWRAMYSSLVKIG